MKNKTLNGISVNLTEIPTEDFLRLYEELVADLKKHYYAQLTKWEPSLITRKQRYSKRAL